MLMKRTFHMFCTLLNSFGHFFSVANSNYLNLFRNFLQFIKYKTDRTILTWSEVTAEMLSTLFPTITFIMCVPALKFTVFEC